MKKLVILIVSPHVDPVVRFFNGFGEIGEPTFSLVPASATQYERGDAQIDKDHATVAHIVRANGEKDALILVHEITVE